MAENENQTQANQNQPEAYIKVDRANPDYMHIEDIIERISAQFRPGQYFKKSDHSVIEILAIKDEHIIFKFLKGQTLGKRILKLSVFAQLFNNNYYMQMRNPDQKIEWELNQNYELERYLR